MLPLNENSRTTPLITDDQAIHAPEPPRKNWTSAVTFVALLLAFIYLTFRMIAPFGVAVFLGAILALLLMPAYRKLRNWNWGPHWAAAVLTIVLALIVIGPIGTFATIAAKQGMGLAQTVVGGETLTYDSVANSLGRMRVVQMVFGDAVTLQNQLRSATQGAAKAASGFLLGLVGNLPNYGLQAALTLLSCFFLLVDGRTFVSWLNDKIPLDWDVRARLYGSFKDTAVSVIWATLAAATAQATLMFTSFLILGVPGAFLAGGATFIFAWVPILGSTPVWLTGAIVLYTQGLVGKMIAMLGFGVFTGIVDNFIRPLVLKGRGEMHPLVSLVAIFGGIGMFGIFGVFLGPILAAVLIALLQTWPLVGRRFGFTNDPQYTLNTPPGARPSIDS